MLISIKDLGHRDARRRKAAIAFASSVGIRDRDLRIIALAMDLGFSLTAADVDVFRGTRVSMAERIAADGFASLSV